MPLLRAIQTSAGLAADRQISQRSSSGSRRYGIDSSCYMIECSCGRLLMRIVEDGVGRDRHRRSLASNTTQNSKCVGLTNHLSHLFH